MHRLCCGILGLIDEMFGIQQSSVRLPAEKFSQQQQQQQQQQQDTKQIVFSSSEEMYAEIRGLNFNAVGPTLSRKVCVLTTVPHISVSVMCPDPHHFAGAGSLI
jgi:hypothetical protein